MSPELTRVTFVVRWWGVQGTGGSCSIWRPAGAATAAAPAPGPVYGKPGSGSLISPDPDTVCKGVWSGFGLAEPFPAAVPGAVGIWVALACREGPGTGVLGA